MVLFANLIFILGIKNIEGVQNANEAQRLQFIQLKTQRSENDMLSELNLHFNRLEATEPNVIRKILCVFDANQIAIAIRKWILCEEEKLYCVYCVCFKNHDQQKSNCLIEGLKTDKLVSALTRAIRNHEQSTLHKICQQKYFKALCNIDNDYEITYNEGVTEQRTIVTTVLKIIIFLATHGEIKTKY